MKFVLISAIATAATPSINRTTRLLRLPRTFTKIPSVPSKAPPCNLTFVPWLMFTSSGRRYVSSSLAACVTAMNCCICLSGTIIGVFFPFFGVVRY